MDVLSSSDGIINGGRSKSWLVTLTSTNGSLKFVNFEPGDHLTLVVQEDTSGSNYTLTFPSNVLWTAGQAPSRNTAASAFNAYNFTFDGTNWRDLSGAGRLPSRIQSAALGTIVGVVLATAAVFTLVSSGGNGQRPGAANLPDIVQYKTGTGAQQVTVGRVNASGSLVLGQSGSLSIGSPTLSATGAQAKFFVKPSGLTVARNTISGSQLTVNAPATSTGYLLLTGPKGGAICIALSTGVYKKVVLNSGGSAFVFLTPATGECTQ